MEINQHIHNNAQWNIVATFSNNGVFYSERYDHTPGLEFLILCLEDSVISIISPSSGGSPGPV